MVELVDSVVSNLHSGTCMNNLCYRLRLWSKCLIWAMVLCCTQIHLFIPVLY